eukprot:4286473-Lingulodinium_polyedra.AAC.1
MPPPHAQPFCSELSPQPDSWVFPPKVDAQQGRCALALPPIAKGFGSICPGLSHRGRAGAKGLGPIELLR